MLSKSRMSLRVSRTSPAFDAFCACIFSFKRSALSTAVSVAAISENQLCFHGNGRKFRPTRTNLIRTAADDVGSRWSELPSVAVEAQTNENQRHQDSSR